MKSKNYVIPAFALVISAILLLAISILTIPFAGEKMQSELRETMEALIPGGGEFRQVEYKGDDGNISAVYQGAPGYVIEAVITAYAGDMTVLVAVDNAGEVQGLVVRDMSETHGLGTDALTDEVFLSQFLGVRGEVLVGRDIDALSAATVTSKAVARAVNSATAFVTGADVSSGATEWGE